MAAAERERAELIKLKKAQMPGKKRIDVMKAKGMAPQHWGSVYRYVDNSDPDYYDFEHERVI
jgi:predicted component of type VI protein secretion system